MSGVIVHEWLESVGGGERVVDALAAEFPDAPILCPWDDVDDRYGPGRVREAHWPPHIRTAFRNRLHPQLVN